LRLAFGTMTKSLQVGSAAMNGARAAVLAQRGLSAPRGALDARSSFFELYQSGNTGPSGSALRRPPATGYYTLETLFKDYPCCFALHGAIDAALQMRGRAGYDCDLIDEIEIVTNPGLPTLCSLTAPSTAEETRFSLPYAVALALTEHDPTSVDAWSMEIAKTPRLTALIERIRPTIRPQSPKTSCTLNIVQSDARRLSTTSEFRYPSSDMSGQWQRLTTKFTRNVAPILGEISVRLMVTKFEHFLELDDASIPLRLTVPQPTTGGATP
jgi:2-methylcitrate dehydratase PrpD